MDIYLDNAATTFPKPQTVNNAVLNCMEQGAVNAGRGVYPLAQEAGSIISSTRHKVAQLLNYRDGHVIFTANATLALNQVLLGMEWKIGDVVYTTPLEHNSVARVLEQLSTSIGIELIQIPLHPKNLEYDLDLLHDKFGRKPPRAVVMTHVSNVCGLITPILEIADRAKAFGAVVIIDGAQGGPLLPLKGVRDLVDFYIFSGHKTFYGHFGIAGFVTNGTVQLRPVLFGGTGSHSELLSMPDELPYKYEVGSPNIVATAGLHAACIWLEEVGPVKVLEHERKLVKIALDELYDLPGLQLYTHADINKHVGILSFTVDGYTAQEVGMILTQNFNIATRTGLHCAPMAHKFLGTLPNGTVRASFGYFTIEDEVLKLVQALRRIVD